MNELYNLIGNQNPMANLQNALAQVRQNPVAILKQAGLNIPNGMNNPQQIVQHLLQSVHVPNARYQQALQMMQGRRR